MINIMNLYINLPSDGLIGIGVGAELPKLGVLISKYELEESSTKEDVREWLLDEMGDVTWLEPNFIGWLLAAK